VDFVKVHNGAPKAAYFALLAEAQKRGLTVAGHLPLDVDPSEAINQGHASLEHIVSLVEGPVTQMMKEGKTQEQAIAAIKDADLRVLAKRMLARGTWFDPTMVAYYKRSYQWETAIKDDVHHQYAANTLKQAWRAGRELPDTPEMRSRLSEGWKRFVHMARVMSEEGVPFLVGTDAGAKFVVPGFDVHEELRILTEDVGLTPLRALQAATINAARCLRKDRELGTIERDKIADMVLLDANPLTDITNTRLIAGVILRGKLINDQERQKLLAAIKTNASQY
jgi:imidazolonepropionase-like amidohydrolase